jgi:hypothetical protein
MTVDKKIIEELFEGFDSKLVSEDLKETVRGMIDSLVETRVAALTTELEEKEAIFIAEAKKLKVALAAREKKLLESISSKEKILEEEANKFAETIAKTLAEKESIMVQESESYRKHVEGIVTEEGKLFKEALESIVVEEADAYRKHIEEIALQEAVSFKTMQDSALAEEVSTFKASMVESISEFLESEIEKSIPAEIMEAEVKLAAYEPLVESMINVFGENYIKLDSTSYDVIKEARKENKELSESVNAKVKENVRLQSEVKTLEKSIKIKELTEGMTQVQKETANKLMESCSNASDVEKEFTKVKDIIIESSVRAKPAAKPAAKVDAQPAKKTFSETAQRKIDSLKNEKTLTESNDPEMAEYVGRLNRQLRNG